MPTPTTRTATASRGAPTRSGPASTTGWSSAASVGRPASPRSASKPASRSRAISASRIRWCPSPRAIARRRRRSASTHPTATARATADVEVGAKLFDLVVFYAQNLAVPPRRDFTDAKVADGKALFYALNCQGCHTPSFTTGKVEGQPQLSNQKIWPYSDLLLHDMGEGLADNRPEGMADGREWRTPPLWGLGLTRTRQRPHAVPARRARAQPRGSDPLARGRGASRTRRLCGAEPERARSAARVRRLALTSSVTARSPPSCAPGTYRSCRPPAACPTPSATS